MPVNPGRERKLDKPLAGIVARNRIDDIAGMYDTSKLPAAHTLPDWLLRELRSDHAGETGAVYIYRGILAFVRDPQLRAFAEEHLETEEVHVGAFEGWLEARHKSILIPLWRIAGWTLGALSLLGGRRGVFVTIEAVETFVVEHYQQQLDSIGNNEALVGVRDMLARFMHDEDHHREDAAQRKVSEAGFFARLWAGVVGGGSAGAVVVSRRV
jgi:ubiquinone biosynthesis monooxygenase Coq7